MAWKTINSTIVYENDWMSVHEDLVVNPKGGKNQYGHVRFKNRAVAIVPLDDDDNIRLVGQHRYTLNTYSWELPMGGAPLGENPLAAAKRELREETGLTAQSWLEILRLHTSNSITDEEGYVFVARDLTEGATEFDETEDLAIRTLPLAEALDMVDRKEITDAITIAALLHLDRIKHEYPRTKP